MSRSKRSWLIVYDDGTTEQVYGEDILEATQSGDPDFRYEIVAVVKNGW